LDYIIILLLQIATLTQVKGFGWIDPNLVSGLLLVGFVLLMPKGLTALTVRALRSLAGKRRGAAYELTAQERTSSP
jgi:uncharacterized membrane protein